MPSFLHYPSGKSVSVGAWGEEIPGKAGGKGPAHLCSPILCAGKGTMTGAWDLVIQDLDPPALRAWRFQHSVCSSCCSLPAGP